VTDRLVVVMPLVGRLESDARVLKTAQSVADLGHDVTVLVADRRVKRPTPQDHGAFRAVLVPMPMLAHHERTQRRLRRRAWRPWPVVYRDDAQREAQRVRAQARDARWSVGGPVQRQWRRVAAGAHRARVATSRWVDERYLAGWTAWDEGPGARLARPGRRAIPMLDDVTDALTKEIWRREPDVVHVHDVHPLEAVAAAVRRMRAAGRTVRVIYDAHEYVAGTAGPRPTLRAAWQRVEAAAMPVVDDVVTVSDPIADALQAEYHLPRRPSVVLNAPRLADEPSSDRDLRAELGLAAGTPLAVYSGGIAAHRGVHVVLDAAARVEGLHLAIVYVPFVVNQDVRDLQRRIAELGVADRVHLVEPVPADSIVAFLSSADVGVHPLSRGPQNHDMALPNKLFDYVHAGLAVVVSDVTLMSAFVREHGIGEVFTSGDVDACEQALRRTLNHLPALRARAADPTLREEFSWENQARALAALYARG
jgi:glycosyltransferase involved in cell wall biosynthesis